ncbi:hypothetical protein J4460_07525 [Candidatus Woesearchaeota archaeon]|nr:hypothetical protein [Candidatus Woesearchaeota archaeon]HIH37749.1 hypothetical protein [Candidatus Woesearchaeota archaeon]HIH48940.1 hypothetical protein [Candidatus Woesearchaeota archaeon]HIJ02701.1 hypothetical protein [Candidatus Woesearchaeota archaeon]
MVYIPKRYGQSRIDYCPFCEKQALVKNAQGVPVCSAHKNATIGEMKCICGGNLEIKEGKFGAFFLCDKCGPINMKKVLEINEVEAPEQKRDVASTKPKKEPQDELVVRGDDPYWCR